MDDVFIKVTREDFEKRYISRAAYDAEVARLRDRVDELEAEARWVSVEQGLPDKPGKYLTLRGKKPSIDIIFSGDYTSMALEWWLADGITHWRYITPPEASE